MSRVLQPHPEGTSYWAIAFTLSASLHVAAAFYALDVIPFSQSEEAPPVSFPDISISSAVLQQRQLAALEPEEAALIPAEEADQVDAADALQPTSEELQPVEAEDVEAVEADALDAVEADQLDAVEAEELEAVEAEELEAVDADALEEVEAEELDATAAEALEQVETEEVAASETEAEELAPATVEELGQAEVEDIAAVTPDTGPALESVVADAPVPTAPISPVLSDTPQAAAIAPTVSSPSLIPITPDDGTSIQGATLAPINPAPVTAAPVIASVQPITRLAPAAPAPRRPPPPPKPRSTASAPPPSPEDLAVLELIDRIRNRFGDRCLIALPQNQGPGLNPLVTLISDEERTMSAFVADVLSDPDLTVDDRRILVDSRQCAALDYARAHRNYPAFRVDLTLQSRIIASGNDIVGRVSGFGGRSMSLVAVDSNGVVTDLRRFTQFRQGTAVLSAPVNINGDARDTGHLLIAIATPSLPDTIAARAGFLAQDFFPQLREETQGQAVLGILPFDVR